MSCSALSVAPGCPKGDIGDRIEFFSELRECDESIASKRLEARLYNDISVVQVQGYQSIGLRTNFHLGAAVPLTPGELC